MAKNNQCFSLEHHEPGVYRNARLNQFWLMLPQSSGNLESINHFYGNSVLLAVESVFLREQIVIAIIMTVFESG